MRHNKGFNHLGRKSAHRKAMLSNMAASLIMHKRISTTIAKAKALRSYVEPIITRSKEDTTHNRRVVFSLLQDKYAVAELFREVAVKVAERPGGYTRILKIGARSGDNAEMCYIELVDYNESLLEAKEAEQKSTRRSRRGAKKKTEGEPTVAKTEDAVEEIVEETEAIAEETAEKVKTEVEETVEEAGNELEEVVEETAEEIVEASEEVIEKAEDVVEKAEDVVKEAVEEVAEIVEEAAEALEEEVKDEAEEEDKDKKEE